MHDQGVSEKKQVQWHKNGVCSDSDTCTHSHHSFDIFLLEYNFIIQPALKSPLHTSKNTLSIYLSTYYNSSSQTQRRMKENLEFSFTLPSPSLADRGPTYRPPACERHGPEGGTMARARQAGCNTLKKGKRPLIFSCIPSVSTCLYSPHMVGKGHWYLQSMRLVLGA